MITVNNVFIETKKEEITRLDSATKELNDLVLYNDDVNTFEHVIECLVEICGHNELQAEQCSFLIHYKGNCIVKHGTEKELETLCVALLDKGLSAKIE